MNTVAVPSSNDVVSDGGVLSPDDPPPLFLGGVGSTGNL